MKHGDKAKAKSAKAKASSEKSRAKEVAGKSSKVAAAKGGGQKAATGKAGGKVSSTSKTDNGKGPRTSPAEGPGFSNPIVGSAFKRALKKYPNAFRRLTD